MKFNSHREAFQAGVHHGTINKKAYRLWENTAIGQYNFIKQLQARISELEREVMKKTFINADFEVMQNELNRLANENEALKKLLDNNDK